MLVVAIAGCQKQAPAPEQQATVAPVAAAATAPADPNMAFDSKAFAGSFKGTLPCADCPGIDESLTLNPDGSFAPKDVYRERAGNFDLSGTWTAETDGQRLRLDPDSKSEQDRVFAITDNDELVPLGADGKPAGGNTQSSLKRSQQ